MPDLILVIFEEIQTAPNEALLTHSDGKPENTQSASDRGLL